MFLRYFNVLALLLTAPTNAFVSQTQTTTQHRRWSNILSAAVELETEPEGGQEMTAISSMPGCRMKQMEELQLKSDIGTPYSFWMTAEVDSSLIKEIRTTILKDAAKKANFPGFRKGQVPPYAQPQITNFAIQESVIKTVQASLDAFGLKALEGSDGEFEVHEDVEAMSKGYKTGDSLQFTASIKAAYDPEVARPAEDSSGGTDVIVDADVIEAEMVEE